MPKHRILTRSIAVFAIVLLLANVSFAANAVSHGSPNPSSNEELPVYMQLLVYVSQLLSQGQEIPKALMNKIAAYYKAGK